MVSVCTGAFALAAAGILDGRRATTHWQNTSELQERYPKIDVDPAVLYIEQGTVATSAGVAAGIDLCLQLVRRDAGSAAAAAIARRMVVPTHRSGGQAQYIKHEMTEVSTFASVCDWALANLDADITIDQLAQRSGWSPRTFTRRFTKETGLPPHRWLNAQRLSLARELLERTNFTIDDIADRVGFGSAGNLRTHFLRETGVVPSIYRQTFAASATQ
jgi:AraC family transcriptional activator FtrA